MGLADIYIYMLERSLYLRMCHLWRTFYIPLERISTFARFVRYTFVKYGIGISIHTSMYYIVGMCNSFQKTKFIFILIIAIQRFRIDAKTKFRKINKHRNDIQNICKHLNNFKSIRNATRKILRRETQTSQIARRLCFDAHLRGYTTK